MSGSAEYGSANAASGYRDVSAARSLSRRDHQVLSGRTMRFQGVLCPLKPEASTCGYCGPPGQRSQQRTNVHAAELIPYQSDIPFTCQVRHTGFHAFHFSMLIMREVGVPDDDRPWLEAVGHVLLQTGLAAILLSAVHDQVRSSLVWREGCSGLNA